MEAVRGRAVEGAIQKMFSFGRSTIDTPNPDWARMEVLFRGLLMMLIPPVNNIPQVQERAVLGLGAHARSSQMHRPGRRPRQGSGRNSELLLWQRKSCHEYAAARSASKVERRKLLPTLLYVWLHRNPGRVGNPRKFPFTEQSNCGVFPAEPGRISGQANS